MTVNSLAVRLRAREEELSAIYTNIPGILFYIVIEPDGDFRFQSVSRDFLVATGLTRQQVVGSLVRDVIPPPSLGMVLNQYREAIRSGQPVRWEEESVYPTGRKYAEVAVTPLCDASGITTHLIGIVHDITERKRMEEERAEGDLRELNLTLEGQKALLQSREELLNIFVKNVPAGVAMFDRDMRYLQVSDRWCADYSVGSSELLGRSHYDVFPDMPGHWKEVHCRALEGETLRADEDRWDRGDGTTTWLRWEVRPWKTSSGIVGGILIFAEDITHRKRMEEALSGMSRKLIQSQEQERARIARELHDDINQRVAMLAIEIERLERRPRVPSEIRKTAHKISGRIKELCTDIEALSHELHSSKLEYRGIVGGMKSWCREFGERQGMQIEFKNSGSFSSLPSQTSVCLFRVLQEALHNSAKHSGVKNVDVQLREEPGEVQLIVHDLGKGFDVAAAMQGRGLGVTSMLERVRLLGGTVTIDSKPHGGTTVYACIPLETHQAQHAGL